MPNPTPIIVPSNNPATPTTNLLVVLYDDKAISVLIDQLLSRSGLTQREVCQRMGITPPSMQQYRSLKRKRPSVQWLARLAQACGATVYVEWPK